MPSGMEKRRIFFQTDQYLNSSRSGISITVGYALQQSARLVKNVEGTEKEELLDLEERLASKVKVRLLNSHLLDLHFGFVWAMRVFLTCSLDYRSRY